MKLKLVKVQTAVPSLTQGKPGLKGDRGAEGKRGFPGPQVGP